MFCPNCGQEKTGSETIFCSRCGFLLSGTAELLQTGGIVPRSAATPKAGSKRKRGLKQGLFIFLLTFLVVPLVAMTCIWLRLGPEPVSVVAVLLSVGGLLRMAYAWLLEEDDVPSASQQQQFAATIPNALPPQQTMPASSYTAPGPGNWRDTNDLQPSVTESTTRLLDEEEQARRRQ